MDPEGGIPDSLVGQAVGGDLDARRTLLALRVTWLEQRAQMMMSPLLRQQETASDLVQQLCADLLPNLSKVAFETLSNFDAWLATCLKRKVLDRYRHFSARRRKRPDPATGATSIPDQNPSPSSVAGRREASAALHKALAKLPADQHRVVVMARLEGHSHADIAAAMGKSEGACRMLLSRAMSTLARLLDDQQPRD